MKLAWVGVALMLAALGTAPPAAGQAQPPPAAGGPPSQETSAAWESFPTMLLERVYRGPLRDTIIQRWRDPVDGTVCFLYIPISAPLLPPQPGARYVQYGANTIGSLSCVHPTQVVQILQPPAAAPQPAAPPTRAGGTR